MKTSFLFLFLICLLVFSNCDNADTDLRTYNLKGVIQKGPFSNGSELTIYELDSKLIPTGRTFHSTITNLGNFEIKGISLSSPYTELVASGFFYNEISGELSSAPVTLRAIVDLTGKDGINVNILTSLEYERVRFLVSSEGLDFENAKSQSENEILKIFNLDNNTIINSELLDISKTREDDAVLLAISTIILGNNSIAEMSRIVNDIVADMKSDGILDNKDIQNSLFSQAYILNTDQIKKNIIESYYLFGVTLEEISDFDEKIHYFLEHSDYKLNFPFELPDSTEWGRNILSADLNKFQPGKTYTMAVKMPETGKIKVKFSILEGSGHFYRLALQSYGWTDHIYNDKNKTCVYSSNVNGTLIEAPFVFEGYTKTKIEIFINDDISPLITKIVTWGGYNNSDFEFPDDPMHASNLLAMNDSTVLQNDSIYKIEFVNWNTLNDNLDFTFTFKIPTSASIEIVDSFNCSQRKIDDRLYLHFTGSNGWVAKLKMKGEGIINLESDFQFKDGAFLKRTYILDK